VAGTTGKVSSASATTPTSKSGLEVLPETGGPPLLLMIAATLLIAGGLSALVAVRRSRS
jgi:LPXTG-motif cell wall-anchored protein